MSPMNTGGHSDEVARVIEFLCSDGASFISGVDILVDGGMVAMVHREWQGRPTPGMPESAKPASEQKPAIKVNELFQVGIVVRDLKKTIELYETTLGIGPWQVYTITNAMFKSLTYNGKPVENVSFMAGMAMAGHLQLELIQPVEGDLPYSDFLREHGEGLHHLGHVRVPDVDAAVRDLEAQGYPCTFAGTSPQSKFAYVDMTRLLGVLVELIEVPQP